MDWSPTFRLSQLDVDGLAFRVRHGGAGPPLLLLHGYPQTHAMWRGVAEALASEFTIVAPDLRGYGGSARPPTDARHAPYSKRAMARDAIGIMAALGFTRFHVAGHDRGARVAYRLALDHPEAVDRLAVLDIVPTAEVWARANADFALGYWHWSFLAQAYPMPETLIAANPAFFFQSRFHGARDLMEPAALQEYLAYASDPAVVHTMCEDYRAGAGIDRQIDEADRGRRKIERPLLVLWGEKGALHRWYDVAAIWRDWAEHVEAASLDCGHFLAEERPDETAAALFAFFGKAGPT